MNGREGPSLKRHREEEEVGIDQAEEEEGLVALVKKRKSDVKQLVNRIATLEEELSAARKKLVAAEALLEVLQEGTGKNVDRKKKKEPEDFVSTIELSGKAEKGPVSISKSQNGKYEARTTEHNPSAVSSSHKGGKAKVITPHESRPGSAPASIHNRSKGTADDLSEGDEIPMRVRMDNRVRGPMTDSDIYEGSAKSRREFTGGKAPVEVDRKERKALERTLGGETSHRVARPSTPLQQQEHVDLIMTIKSKTKAQPVSFYNPFFSSCQHRRKMRSLVLNPSSETQFATSALDGVINFWQIAPKVLDINFRYTIDCLSPEQRHWPEDLAWHPDGHSLFAIYTADNKDAQVAVIKNDQKEKSVTFLPDKPHIKGLLNGITFMPWSSSQFVTGGSDHMVQLWRERDGEDTWKPTLLHRNLHTSAVLGVAGTRHKQLVLSAGADKRVIGFDPAAARLTFKHDLESKAMTVLPNTVDFNLFMVQTGQPNKQLHLFDIRARTELHTFGWQQDSSDSQSALITQSWSPDGYYTASGSADPKIVLFDIRFNGREPVQTVHGHQKRVFMAVWHQTLPLMLSISSDLNIGIHKMR